ncbi:MAG: hypothetical protein AB7F43_09255 [Bacteriovoracia bacterium]
MTLDQSTGKNNFIDRLAYFGGAITANPSKVSDDYQDLEQFVIDATMMMADDVRVTQCFLNWLVRYGVLLCPSKLRRLLKTSKYDKSVLGVFFLYLVQNDLRPTRWNILKRMGKKRERMESLFPHLPVPKSTLNENFKQYGILAHAMTPNPAKYLLPAESVLKQCPEIAYRALMIGTVASDILSFVKKAPESKTPYEIAKCIHHHRAQVYSVVQTMERVGNKIW